MTDTPSRPVDERVEIVETAMRESNDTWSNVAVAILAALDAQHPKPVTLDLAAKVRRTYDKLIEERFWISEQRDEHMRTALEQAGITTSAREDEALREKLAETEKERDAFCKAYQQRDDAPAVIGEACRQRADAADELGVVKGQLISIRSELAEAEAAGRILTDQLEKALDECDEWKARAETAEAKLTAAQHQAPDVGAGDLTDEHALNLYRRFCLYDGPATAEKLIAALDEAGITVVLARRQALGAAQQGEPSDEQVEAAVDAFYAGSPKGNGHGTTAITAMRRALRAAQITAPAVEGGKPYVAPTIDEVFGRPAPSPDPLPVEQITAVLEPLVRFASRFGYPDGKEARAALDMMKEGV